MLNSESVSLGCLTAAHSAALLNLPVDWVLPRNKRAAQRAVGNMVSPVMARLLMKAAMAADSDVQPPITQSELDAVAIDVAPSVAAPIVIAAEISDGSAKKRHLEEALDELETNLARVSELERVVRRLVCDV